MLKYVLKSKKESGLFFPSGRRGKRGAGLLLGIVGGMALAGAVQCDPKAVVIPHAARVDLSHVGMHTHENFVRFDTGTLDVAAMRQDAARYPHLTVRGSSRLPTDHAALPPEWASPGDAPLDNPYGPIQGQGKRPGWEVTAGQEGGKNWVKVIVPTRFANWVALQPEKVRRRYLDPRSYSLRVRWGGDS